jgi:hypothetical protein
VIFNSIFTPIGGQQVNAIVDFIAAADRYQLAGITAAAISFIGSLLYIAAVRNGTTEAIWSTWSVWLSQGILILLSNEGIGAKETNYKAYADVVGYSLILIAIILFAEKKAMRKRDKFFFGVAVMGSALLWFTMQSAFWVLILNLIVDATACVPTACKAYKNPETEDRYAWTLIALNSLVNLLAIRDWMQTDRIIYAMYFAIINGILAAIVLWPRKKLLLESFIMPAES